MALLQKTQLGLALILLVGCGSAEQGGATNSVPQPVTKVEIASIDWKSPVTQQDLEDFKAIVDQLPLQQVPEFARADLGDQNGSTMNVKQYISHLRQSYRSAIDPQRQGDAWLEDSEVAKSFQRVNVDPHNFAALATKISLAWSASTVKGEVPILATQRRLREQLEALIFDVEHPSPEESVHQREQRLSVIRETIALSEFLTLIKEVPEESLAVVQANSDVLQHYLPQASLQNRFEKRHESSPSVIHVGHSSE
ncbi:hypothetical protein [Thalassoglobus polymorphus]|uniref:Uncharacterized protein n=1 Tax=Thalassoglobus polymorphus TaxID=2527994 RepID=A0A517QKB0_9PLAN|nr:hypothetical protein [Thalassoglobus polymorphus]QDT32076.1 hypothetical protein Mal48_13170 [Thalassoglobus polymorphus]